jgi:hypothetical protein
MAKGQDGKIEIAPLLSCRLALFLLCKTKVINGDYLKLNP